MKSSGRNSEMLRKLLGIGILVACWELFRIASGIGPILLPSVGSILLSLFRSFTEESLFRQIILSLLLVGTGLIAAILLSIFLVFISLQGKFLYSFVDLLISVFHPLPGIALLPIIILWMGTGVEAIILIIIHSIVWPMTTNLKTGYQSIPSVHVLVARNFEIPPVKVFFRITLPGSMPYMISGIKIGWARAWRALISAEMIFGAAAGVGGLGWFIYSRRVFMDSKGLFGGLCIVIAIGLLVERFLIRRLEKKTVWKWGMSIE